MSTIDNANVRSERISSSRKTNVRPKARPPPQINKRSSFYTKMYQQMESSSSPGLVMEPQIMEMINNTKKEPVKATNLKISTQITLPPDDRSQSVKVSRPSPKKPPN